MRFERQVAIVTGGGSGIGAATARELAEGGAKVAIFDFDGDKAQAVADEIAGAAFKVDVADRAALETAIEAVEARFGRLDLLCNNAGVGCFGRTPDLDPEEWERVIRIDLSAVFYACRKAIPIIARQGGAIVNTASISGLAGDYAFTAYNAAKAGVINYTRALAIDHARDGIRVNAICPGLIATPLTGALQELNRLRDAWISGIPMKREGRPEEMAKVIAFLLSEDASYMTGSIVIADGGATAHTGQPEVAPFMAS